MDENIFELIPQLKYVEKRPENGWRSVKSYVLRGQKLKDFQINALKEHYNDYGINYSENKLDFRELFGNDHPVVIEIGFGMGDATAKIAKANPDINYIGIEVFLYGYSKLMAKIADLHLNNLKIIRFDAVEVLNDMISDKSIKGFHIFFPDPWPKKRHHARRLINPAFVDLLKTKLTEEGYIYCVTDWQEYADEMLEIMSKTEGLKNPYNNFAEPADWRPLTNFEQKGLDANRKINEVFFVRE